MCLGRIGVIAIAAVLATALIGALLLVFASDRNRLPAETLALGRAVYQRHCAGCHGAKLEGQPDWQKLLVTGRLPAPPHDQSGHTWHHSDRVLLEIIKYGTAAVVGGGYQSDMPPFASVLSDEEIRAVLAFIKDSWPDRERRYQQEMTRRAAVSGGRS
ncbi:MAG TPA: cytochrome c [Bradyrhizobium sp.]|nr:cytochrome c [Bradyrhizobium sp.]